MILQMRRLQCKKWMIYGRAVIYMTTFITSVVAALGATFIMKVATDLFVLHFQYQKAISSYTSHVREKNN